MSSLYFQIISTLYLVMLSIIYFSKKRLESIENKIYSGIIFSTIFLLFMDLISTYIAIVDFDNPFLNITSKIYLVALFLWLMSFTMYTVVVSFYKKFNDPEKGDKAWKKLTILFSSLIGIVSTIIMVLPLYNHRAWGKIYTYGPGAQFMYTITPIAFAIVILIMIIKFKEVKTKKFIPMISYILLSIIGTFIQYSYPEILFVTSMAVFVTILMYFTIENPDLKLINELNIAKSQAERANMAKTDFLSSMSHEIRTPLNAIVGFSEDLRDQDLPEEAKEQLGDIVSASTNLLEIVNGILDISKIEANKLEIVEKEYNFSKVKHELVALAKGRLGEKPLEFITEFEPDLPRYMYGDFVRLKQIIINLLTNSIKYTKEGYIKFKISSLREKDICRLIVVVEDSGIGIKKEMIGKLFTKFERFDKEKNMTIEGTGLGLAITKKLIDLMNGQINVQSEYGVGTKITVVIDQKIIHKEDEEVEIIEIDEELDVKGFKILVVDDNKINIKVASKLLSRYELNIDTCLSGEESIEKIKANDYSLIFMDDMMPGMSGIETLHKLKEDKNFNLPVIALTANALTGMREKYLNEGFQGYLSKPINKRELEKILRKHLK